MDELYDLDTDPQELHNVIHEPASGPTLSAMQTKLDSLLAATH
jgi:hypothetical protein